MSGTRPCYTSDTTRIVLSFANANGGDLFAQWLRKKLMEELNYFSQNAVYLDNIASRNVGNQINHCGVDVGATLAQAGDNSVVGPDLRGPGRQDFKPGIGLTSDGSYVPIGAMNSRWLEMWLKALSEAKVLIQIQTKEYFESDPCKNEMAKIRAKLAETGNNLEVLAISFDGDVPAMTMGGGTTPMQLTKVPGGEVVKQVLKPDPETALKGFWQIGWADLVLVTAFLQTHGC